MNNSTFFGVPSMALLPARNFTVNTVKEISLVIPNVGDYESVVPDEEGKDLFKDFGNFTIFDGTSLNFLEVSKLLFATRQYPDLKDNELFVPLQFNIKVEDNKIIITGLVVALE